MDADKRRKLIALLGMIGSAHDGEVLNAAKMAQRLLGSEGLTWEEAMNGGGGESSGDSRSYLRGYQAGYDEGYGKGKAAGRMSAAPASQRKKPDDFVTLAETLRDHYDRRLNDWERGFVESYIDRGYAHPTEKQRAVFEKMARKCELDLPE